MKSGTANAEVGAEAKEETCEGAATGSVQNTTDATSAEKSCEALAETGAMGAGCELGADCETQHEPLHVQQLRFGSEKLVGADANA